MDHVVAREFLFEALRYPWPAAADHAAQATVRLNDVDALPKLREMLHLPDPLAPFQDVRGKWVVNELVRVNHLRNCLLCHPPSQSTRDLLRGVIPTPGEPLPVAYNSRRGSFVKADVTYLKQDFSATLPVADHDKWPAQQRYDFFIRTRPVSANERMAWSNKNQQDRRAPLG